MPFFSNCPPTHLARSMGIAKPTPSYPPELVEMAVLMPITSPSRLTSGPPLLPGLMAASVWMKSSRSVMPRPRPLALTMPAVTVPSRPKGWPRASTQSPTSTSLLLPSLASGSEPPALMRTMARSVLGSVLISLGLEFPPVGQPHGDIAAAGDDVVIGKNNARTDRRSRPSRCWRRHAAYSACRGTVENFRICGSLSISPKGEPLKLKGIPLDVVVALVGV